MTEFKFNCPEIQIVINSSLDKSLAINKQQMNDMSVDIKNLEAYLNDRCLPFAVERKYIYNDKEYMLSWERFGDNPRIYLTDLDAFKNAVYVTKDKKDEAKAIRPLGDMPVAVRFYFFKKLPDFLKYIHQSLIKHQELQGL